MGKKMEKVENQFRSNPFFNESRNLILFFRIHPSKNEIVHIELWSTPVCRLFILHVTWNKRWDLQRLRDKSLIEASFFNLIEKSLITDI